MLWSKIKIKQQKWREQLMSLKGSTVLEVGRMPTSPLVCLFNFYRHTVKKSALTWLNFLCDKLDFSSLYQHTSAAIYYVQKSSCSNLLKRMCLPGTSWGWHSLDWVTLPWQRLASASCSPPQRRVRCCRPSSSQSPHSVHSPQPDDRAQELTKIEKQKFCRDEWV